MLRFMSPAAPDYVISTDPERLDLDWIHDRLSTDTYWASGRTRQRVAESIAHSRCYGMYAPDGGQVAFARIVTDFTAIAWLGDVYVDRSVRGNGLSKQLLWHIMDEVRSWKVRRVVLATNGADGLYRQLDFTDMSEDSSDWMQVKWPDHV